MRKILLTVSPPDSRRGFLDPIDISDTISGESGISKIAGQIDSSDYAVGAFSLPTCRLTLLNLDGRLSVGTSSSIFPFGRDGAMMHIRYADERTQFPIFAGLVDDDASRENFRRESITFTITSPDSILRRTVVTAGVVGDNVRASEAIFRILDRPPINQILKIKRENINLDYDALMDRGGVFIGKSSREALNGMLFVCNSILYVNEDNEIIIEERSADRVPRRTFYGPFDVHRRSPNVLNIVDYNTGSHRIINQVSAEGVLIQDTDFIEVFGLKNKSITFDSIVAQSEKNRVAGNLVRKYRVPKKEMRIVVKLQDTQGIHLNDRLLINYPSKKTGNITLSSRYGQAQYGKAKYGGVRGTIEINDDVSWIVYEFSHNLKDYTSTFKLREAGVDFEDAFVAFPPSFYGRGKYGQSRYSTADFFFVDPRIGKYGRSRYGVAIYAK